MFGKKVKAAQGEFWVAAHQLPQTPKGAFYTRLDETLESFGFTEKVRAICTPAYKQNNAGRPGIDPVVYLKMIMIGFFEDLPSERAVAARCADGVGVGGCGGCWRGEEAGGRSGCSGRRERVGLGV